MEINMTLNRSNTPEQAPVSPVPGSVSYNKSEKVKVSALHKKFRELHVLKGVDITIGEGEVVCVIGPSGSGKSTLLRCLNKLEEATEGEIVIDGCRITDKKVDINKIRANIGMVFQSFNLFSHMTVKKNVMFAPTELKILTKPQA